MADVVTREGLLARVQHLAPIIRAHADCNFTRQAGSCPLLVIVEREIACATDVHPVGRSRACSTRQAATPV